VAGNCGKGSGRAWHNHIEGIELARLDMADLLHSSLGLVCPLVDERTTETTGTRRPTRAQAEEAVRTLISWAGDNPQREGLRDTPAWVVRAYEDWFSGYARDPADQLRRTFDEVGGFDEIVLLRDIPFESFCEHHMAPIIGRAHIGYLPNCRVVGISKLARLLDMQGVCKYRNGSLQRLQTN
jgi:hypothetical protein